MILTDHQIEEAVKSGVISIEPFEPNHLLQSATYDLRVGNQGATTSQKKMINIEENGFLLLAPGDFAIVTVFEKISLGPQYAARIGLRSKYARKGLIATTGPQIDPGYSGRLILGITNLTPRPVPLPHKDELVSIEFHKLEEPVKKPYNGPYQNRDELRPEDIEMIVESDGMALSEVLTVLGTLNRTVGVLGTNVGNLTKDINNLKWIIPIIITIGIAIIGIIVALK